MQYQADRKALFMFGAFTIICVLTLFARNAIVGNRIHDTLIWNLFLGAIPLIIALLIMKFQHRLNNLWLFVTGGVWLLFYPNSPYIISDFIHLRQETVADVVVYDTLVIFLFAMLSFYYGLYSLRLAWIVLRERYGLKSANSIISLCILLASLGFYLGRVVRLNSWDVFTKPLKVLADVWNSLFPIADHWAAYAMMFLFALAQIMVLLFTRGYKNFD